MFGIALTVVASSLLIFLSAYSLVRQRSIAGVTFSVFCLLLALIEVLDRMSIGSSYNYYSLRQGAMFAESLLPATLYLFSVTFARQSSTKLPSRPQKALLVVAALFPLSLFFFPRNSFFYSPDLHAEGILFLSNAGYWFYLGIMISMIIALMNIETTFSSIAGRLRWRIKFEVVGIAGILAILIFYYSQGLLYRTINMNLIPVRSGVFIMAACMIAYSKLFRGEQAKVTVSRYIVYRSVTLLFVGLYLLILGIIGEGMKYLNLSIGRDLAIFAAFATAIMMLSVFLSERLRRRVKIFIGKNFYPHKHDYRNQWLNFTERLAACRSFACVQDAILTSYRMTFGLKGVSLYLLDRDKGSYLPAASQSMPDDGPWLQAGSGLVSFLRDQESVYLIAGEGYVPVEEEVFFIKQSGARLIVSLAANDEVEGFVVFGEQLVRERFTYEDYDLMKTVAKQAALSIINFRLSEELGATREIAAVGRISSFVMHDLKNLTSNLSLTLDNAEDYIHDPEFQGDMISTVRHTLSKMKDLIQRLKAIPDKQELKKGPVEMDLLAKEVVDEVRKVKPDVAVEYHGLPVLALVDGEEIRKVVLNLLLNAVDALGKEGTINIAIAEHRDDICIEVADNGVGMSDDFIARRLFKPFQTTKRNGLGIGLYQCKQIIDAHGGTIEVESEAGKGSVFTVRLPSADAEGARMGQ